MRFVAWQHKMVQSLLGERRGWILMDAMIGATILTIGVTAVVFSVRQMTVTTVYSDRTTQAVTLAQQKLLGLKTMTLVDNTTTVTESVCGAKTFGGTINSQTISLPTTTTDDGFTISYEQDTTTKNLSPVSSLNLIPVRVTVAWTDKNTNSAKSVTLLGYYFYYIQSGTTCS